VLMDAVPARDGFGMTNLRDLTTEVTEKGWPGSDAGPPSSFSFQDGMHPVLKRLT